MKFDMLPLHQGHRIGILGALILVGLSGMSACGEMNFDNSTLSPSSPTETVIPFDTPTPLATETQVATYEPTYVVYGRALRATAVAIAETLPTPTLVPNLRPDLQQQEKQNYLYYTALDTAVALFPPPPDYDPSSERTPFVQLTPLPTELPIPKTPTGNGSIYNVSLEDDPMGKQLAHVNHWGGRIDGQAIGVFAGHVVGNPAQGILVIRTHVEGDTEHTSRYDYYLSPPETGALRITDETGGLMILQAANNGTLLYFDLRSRQWVPSPSPSPSPSPLPSVSPLPTMSP